MHTAYGSARQGLAVYLRPHHLNTFISNTHISIYVLNIILYRSYIIFIENIKLYYYFID